MDDLRKLLKDDLSIKLINNKKEATIFLYNILGLGSKHVGAHLEIKAYSYQLHDALRTLFLLIDQSCAQIQNISPQEIYNNFFKLYIVIGSGAYGAVYDGAFLKESGFVVKSSGDSVLDEIKITHRQNFRFQQLGRFLEVKATENKNLLREYIINRRLNQLNLPIFQQTYAFINCSRPIADAKRVFSFCTIEEPGVIVSQHIKGENMRTWIRTAKLDDILTVFTILFQNMATAHDLTGFTHYDLHPGNILIEELPREFSFRISGHYIHSRYVPKIIDFGMSRIDIEKTVLSKTGFEEYGINNRPNLMYDIYKIIMYSILENDKIGFLAEPFFGRAITKKDAEDINQSKSRQIRGNRYKDAYFILPDNVDRDYNKYLDFLFARQEVIDLIGPEQYYPEYGFDNEDHYEKLRINYEKFILPVENLYQLYVFELTKTQITDLTTRRIKMEGMYFYEKEFYDYLNHVDDFTNLVRETIKKIDSILKSDNSRVITDSKYGSKTMRSVYLLIAQVIQGYTNLAFQRKVLSKTKRDTNYIVPQETIKMGILKEYRTGSDTKDLFDALATLDDFDPNLD